MATFAGTPITATVIGGGNAGNLEAETSLSRTGGIVWQPRSADLSVSVDYFNIKVKNEVIQLGADQILLGCYSSEFFPNEPLCDLFGRVAFDQRVDNVIDRFINIASQKIRGWDVAALYRFPLGGGGLTIETQHTSQEADDQGTWSFFWGVNFIGSSSNTEHYFDSNPPRPIAVRPSTSSLKRTRSFIMPPPSAMSSRVWASTLASASPTFPTWSLQE